MDKIYEARLREVLDELYLTTVTTIPWTDIYMWFGTQKITKTPYRHFQKEWEELCDAPQRVWPERITPPKLYMVKNCGFRGLLIQRELFDDETLVDFDELAA